jgi:predicted permease
MYRYTEVNGTVFLPCLLFTALGRSVTLEHLRNVWLLPLAAVRAGTFVCGAIPLALPSTHTHPHRPPRRR